MRGFYIIGRNKAFNNMDIIQQIAEAIKNNTPFNKKEWNNLSDTDKVSVIKQAIPMKKLLKRAQTIGKRKIKHITSQQTDNTFFGQFINDWVRVRLLNKPDAERLTLKLLPTILKDFSTEKSKMTITLEMAICPQRTCPKIYNKIINFAIGKTKELPLNPEESVFRQPNKVGIWLEKLICFNINGFKTYINHDAYNISFVNNLIKILNIYSRE